MAGAIGAAVGLLGGYFGGRLDRITVWIGDVQMAIPFVVVAIGVSASFKPSALNVVLILGRDRLGHLCPCLPSRRPAAPSRCLRRFGQGCRSGKPGGSSSATAASNRPTADRNRKPAGRRDDALRGSAQLSLGLGVPAGTITWGGMIADARETAQTAWWATVVPGVAIVLVVIGFNVTGAVESRRLVNGTSTRRIA